MRLSAKTRRTLSLAKAALAAAVCVLCLQGCGKFFGGDENEGLSAEQLYGRAKTALQNRRYHDAVEKYQELETTYPFNPNAQNAMLELAYAHYKTREFASTIEILERFIKIHPNHRRIAYAHYLKGLAHYNYATGALGWLLNRDRTNKDTQPMERAFEEFSKVRDSYPDSKYVEDADRRMVELRNILAAHEIKVADYYLRRGAYVAVVNRIQYTLTTYAGAQHTPQALLLLATAYDKLGKRKLARDALRVLALNYPDTYEEKKHLFSGLLVPDAPRKRRPRALADS